MGARLRAERPGHVSGNTLAARSTAGAGAVNVNTGTLVAINSTISDNSNTARGSSAVGGILITIGGPNSNVVASTISGNSLVRSTVVVADAAGGILANLSPLSLTNVTVTGNNSNPVSAANSVGGVFSNLAANLTVTNATIADNLAAAGGTAGNLEASGSGTHTLRNSIVAGGVAPSGSDCAGTFTSGGGNLVDTNQCGLNVALGDQANTNPNLAPLQDNGGPTPTRAIPAVSAAVDAAVASFCPATDQRAVVRPQGGGCDVGAFEVGPPVNVAAPAITVTPVSPARSPARRAHGMEILALPSRGSATAGRSRALLGRATG